MRRKLTWVVLLSAAIMVTALFHASPAWATPANGFTSTPLAQGQFDQFNIFNSFVLPDSQVWLSRQWTKGLSDGAVLINVWQLGEHRLAHASWPYPNLCHGRNSDTVSIRRS